MTGSKLQWYNGLLLLSAFFCCRLLWGTYQSLRVYQDVWHAMHLNTTGPMLREIQGTSHSPIFVPRDGQLCLGEASCLRAQTEVMKYTGAHTEAVPFWIAGVYLTCNLVLNSLNFYWFGKMVEAVRKRFDGTPADGDSHPRKRQVSVVEEMATELDYETLSGPKTPEDEKVDSFAKTTALPEGSAQVKRR